MKIKEVIYLSLIPICAHAHITIKNETSQAIQIDSITLLAFDGVNQRPMFLQDITIEPNQSVNTLALTGGNPLSISEITIQTQNQSHRFIGSQPGQKATITITPRGITTTGAIQAEAFTPATPQHVARRWGVQRF